MSFKSHIQREQLSLGKYLKNMIKLFKSLDLDWYFGDCNKCFKRM
jgi:hypothetical protein